jgi:endonuclease I/type IX secretion system substrate protein
VPFTINLDTSITRTLDSALIYVKNPSNVIVNVTAVRNTSLLFFTRVNSFSINANDSTGIWIIFSSINNLTYRSFLIFENSCPAGGIKYSIVLGLMATAKYPDVIYSFTQGLIDENLKSALKSFTGTGYISLGYNTARDKMFETVDDYGGDTIECIYSGRRIHAINRTEAQNQNFDTEHTWPQSNFNQQEPERSDLNHLYPTYSPANNARSNYPFGFVVSGITYQDGGSKLGRDIYNNIVFEPRDVQKGNTARSVFYMVIRYQNWGSFLTQVQETALRQFCVIDTVNARDRLRNTRVKSFQNNQNPFIDHPEFVDRIFVFYTTGSRPLKPEITASPFNIRFDDLQNPGDTTSYSLSIFNYGTANLTIGGINSNNGVFSVINFPSSIPANQYGLARIKFTPNAPNHAFTGVLTINNNDSNIAVNMLGVCGIPIGITAISSEIPSQFSLGQNYPNPFNPVTSFRFQVSGYGKVEIAVYNILGKEVTVLVNQNLQPGTYKTEFEAANLPSGVYFYRLQAVDYSETKRMILIK